MYDVGGHKLYMSCAGDGPVTVVYVHGWVNDTGYIPHDSATGIRDLLVDDYRVCLYDRRNVGSSQTVDAVQTPADMRRDMEAVLEAGGVDPPYILMAASFGGLVATSYLTSTPTTSPGWCSSTPCSPTNSGWTATFPESSGSSTTTRTTPAARSSASRSTT